MARFPSEEWFRRYRDAINESDTYREMATEWEGDITYVIEPEPDKGVPDEVYAWVDLWHGGCRDAKIVSPDEGERARYVIRAPYSRWKEVLRGGLEPTKAMTQGKLRLKGDLPAIVKNVKAANELVNIAAGIPTEFPDEQ